MSSTYGQYCPLALSAELLCTRWTLLIISRLLDGCRRFNEIHRGVPQISPTLLSRRLRELESAGLLVKEKAGTGSGYLYQPSQAAQELAGTIDDLAAWGQRWARDMTTEDLDPAFLVWSMHLRLDAASLPEGRTVMEFEFSGAPKGSNRFWLINENSTPEMCLKDPGFDVDLLIRSDLLIFVEVWRGFRDLGTELRRGRIRLIGPAELRHQFPSWLKLSALASDPRLCDGKEKQLANRYRRSIQSHR